MASDPILLALRKKYPKQGMNPTPGTDINKWAEKYLSNLRSKTTIAEQMIKSNIEIDDICKKTKLRKEIVETLQSYSKKKKGKSE